ncbi:MAG: hypothetical protein JRH06_14625 [Deltaproteobacteria bacterium]|nr:hypothetical protein [Deltaproteobacteria bacterium]MBW2138771.1 hypothetical protein [Deltaproteobacteria bacterium]
MKKFVILLFVLFLSLVAVPVQSKAAGEKGQSLFEKKCGICHSTNRAKSKRKTRAQWEKTVLRIRTGIELLLVTEKHAPS